MKEKKLHVTSKMQMRTRWGKPEILIVLAMPASCHFAFVCHKPVGERLVHVAFQNIGLSCSIGKLQNLLGRGNPFKNATFSGCNKLIIN